MGPGRPSGAYKINEDKLKSYVDENPDAFLEEISMEFGVNLSAISMALSRLNISRKKSTLYRERCEVKQKNYLENISSLAPEKLVYIDESGIDKFISKEHAGGG